MNSTKIKKSRTNRSSVAWQKLCEYVEKVYTDKDEEFWPMKHLGADLFSQIDILPASIDKLTHVKKLILYGSNLVMIPPQIGKMESLETFTPYTSYNLCWFPYEIVYCKHLKESTVSTRALYYNPKNRKPFPDLIDYPVRYDDPTVCCSVCQCETTYQQVNQYWISLQVATDILPLLVNICSYACAMKLPKPAQGYPPFLHRGGKDQRGMSIDDWVN